MIFGRIDVWNSTGDEPLANVPLTPDDLKNIDDQYRPFPAFAEWAKLSVNTVRWDRYVAQLADRGRISPEHLQGAYEIAARAAALDTGAIEGLYPTDRGVTLTFAKQAAIWEAKFAGTLTAT